MMSKPGPERPELDKLIEKARKHVMTPAERYDQRISFAYGQVSIENSRVTREMVEKIAREIYGPRPT